ncbi:OB-fold nucleic acid binding domain-containing protein, partial [Patescibacteria group bacterium]|nr:OB-fold nucleic acid binding domain-containing protein [Patescibacteria group bacterium]
MSTTQTLTITTPDGTVSRVVMPTHISFEQNMGEISGFTAEFQSDWDDFLDETDGTNPVQMNATVEWIREGQVYAFFIISRELIEAENGEQVIKITCLDPLAKLTTTVAASNRQTIWTRTTPSSHTASNYIATSPGYIRLYQVEPIGDALYPFFPICADEVWLPRTDEYANYTTLGRPLGNGTHPVSVVDTGTHHFYSVDNIAAQLLDGIRFEVSGSTGNDGWYTCSGDANWTGFLTEIIVSETIPDATADGYIYPREIIATASQAGMNPAGFIIINTEWIQYDGYDYTDYSNSYIFRNCYRGMLGSTAATHLADATIWQALSQKIHPSAEVLLAGSSTANGWEVISGSYYAVQPEEGRFDFTLDIENLKTGADKYVNFAAGYGVFDETDSHNTIRLASEGWVEPFAWGILDTVLSQERKAGGPNCDSWERDFGIYKIATVYTGTNTIQVYARQGEVLSVGDSITITGSVGAANDGAYTVVSATDVDLGANDFSCRDVTATADLFIADDSILGDAVEIGGYL